ncbi:MAG: 6-phosphogluconolactonase [Granulosicoccus sp.]
MISLLERAVCAESRDALARQLAETVAGDLDTAIEENNSATLVVSGGSTPRPLFAALSSKSIDWSRVIVTLADERWVAPDQADSNERMVREQLLVNYAGSARFVSLYRPAAADASTLADIETSLAQLANPFTVVLLGMGEDGHTASLFPDAPEIEAAMSLDEQGNVMFMQPPSVGQTRITFTRRRLLATRHLYLHITGKNKWHLLESALSGGKLPIAGVATEAGDNIQLYWAA